MTIDLRSEALDFQTYLREVIETNVRSLHPKPSFIHFGFYFDQDGWLVAYFDTRDRATMDGEWSKHLGSYPLLLRPHWYEASEFSDLSQVRIIGIDGAEVSTWLQQPDLTTFAYVLGEFIKSSVLTFIDQGLFRPLIESQTLEFCVEELTGLYVWPANNNLFNELSR